MRDEPGTALTRLPAQALDDEDILRVQRRLRKRLFEGSGAIRWRPGRELAAQLLLYLDDPQACWRITTAWLRETLDADRVDGGFGGFIGVDGRARPYVAVAETQRDSTPLPSVLGLEFSAFEPGLRAAWQGPRFAAIGDVSQERTFTAGMRSALHEVGTAAKLALPLRDGARPVGIICADWHREAPRWNGEVCHQLGLLGEAALGPLLATVERFDPARAPTAPSRPLHEPAAPPRELAGLTPAELEVAQLAAMGLSYKEVARRIDRSLSTVDHRLRCIRDKLGVRSTARLAHVLSERLERARN